MFEFSRLGRPSGVVRASWRRQVAAAGGAGLLAAAAVLAGAGTAAASLTGAGVVPSHIYWDNQGDATINEANLDGTSPHAIVTGLSKPVGVAVGG